MSELHVVATIPAKPEAAEAVREVLETLVAATRQEAGCISYDLFESAAVPGTFVTVERWVDQAAMDLHMQTPHTSSELEGPLTCGGVARFEFRTPSLSTRSERCRQSTTHCGQSHSTSVERLASAS